MGTNADYDEKAVAGSLAANNNGDVHELPTPSDEKPLEEPTFDTGFKSWIQVLGSFFLFFNSWYVWPYTQVSCRASTDEE